MEKLVLFGTCGVLNRDIEATSIIIPTAALRDEGTSYHYLPASDEVEVNKKPSLSSKPFWIVTRFLISQEKCGRQMHPTGKPSTR